MKQLTNRIATKSSGRIPLGNGSSEWIVMFIGAVITGLFCLMVVRILWDIVSLGASNLRIDFLTQNPSNGGRSGGIYSVLVSTFWILFVAIVVATPISVGSAFWLSEFSGRSKRIAQGIRVSLDILAGIPSVVFGLAGNVFFCQMLGMGYSLLAGGLTLACMILPLMTRILENTIRSIPESYRLAASCLGFSKFTLVWRVLLPQAFGGILTGIVLGVCRAVSETAALLFTSGSVDRVPESWFDSGRTLSVHVYELAMNPGGDANANSTALVLILLVIGLSSAASLLAIYWSRK